ASDIGGERRLKGGDLVTKDVQAGIEHARDRGVERRALCEICGSGIGLPNRRFRHDGPSARGNRKGIGQVLRSSTPSASSQWSGGRRGLPWTRFIIGSPALEC